MTNFMPDIALLLNSQNGSAFLVVVGSILIYRYIISPSLLPWMNVIKDFGNNLNDLSRTVTNLTVTMESSNTSLAKNIVDSNAKLSDGFIVSNTLKIDAINNLTYKIASMETKVNALLKGEPDALRAVTFSLEQLKESEAKP